MRLLRDKAELTRVLLLLELERTTHTRLQDIAAPLGITVQGVSAYIAELEKEGLVAAGRGRYGLTTDGRQLLQERLAELKGFVDLAYQRTSHIERTATLARTRARKGERVGLFLEEGVLVGRARRASPSRGVAAHDAAPGEILEVEGLEGLVDLTPGRLVVLRVPPAPGARTKAAGTALRRWLAKERPRPQRVGATGTEAVALARAAGREPDFLFAPVQAAHHAAQLGLHVALVASAEQVPFATAELDRLDAEALEPVRHQVRDLRVAR